MVGQIYPTKLQLNKTDSSDTDAPFLDLSIANDIVPSKIYNKWDDFRFEIVHCPFLIETFLSLLSMVHIFLGLFLLRECVLTLVTSTTEA